MSGNKRFLALRRPALAATFTAASLMLALACGDDDPADGGAAGDGGTNGDAAVPDGDTPEGGGQDVVALNDALQSDGEGGEPLCGGESVVGENVVVNLLVVIDRSGSMKQTPTGFVDNKWDTMVGALNTSLGGIQDKMNVGLLFFPDPAIITANGCGMSTGSDVSINIDVGATTVPLIGVELEKAANEPEGNTPTADALALAHRYFTDGPGKDLQGDKYVLLALDGGPNCNGAITCDAASCTTNIDRSLANPSVSACPLDPASCCEGVPEACLDDEATIGQLSALWDEGIPTFVVKIPDNDLYGGVLDELAVAGGVPANPDSPKYFEVSDANALTDTLVAITRNLVKSCEFQLTETPPDVNKVNVYIDGEVLPQQGEDGWHYDNSTTPPTIVITGATCEQLESEGAENVTFEFGCPTIIVK